MNISNITSNEVAPALFSIFGGVATARVAEKVLVNNPVFEFAGADSTAAIAAVLLFMLTRRSHAKHFGHTPH